MDWKIAAGGVVLAASAAGSIWTAANVIGRLDYVQKAVTPEAMIEYRVREAQRVMREEMRFCVHSELILPDTSIRGILRCLE